MKPIQTMQWLCLTWTMALLTGCAGGASVEQVPSGRYAVQVPYTQLDFTIASPSQSGGSITATAAAVGIQPELYFKYQVESRVNGNYALMPSPPMAYTIRRIPFYKTDTETVTVHLDLHNDSAQVVSTGQAVCSFDINGKTVSSTPLKIADLLPGHDISVDVSGPTPDQFGTANTGTMAVWVYGIGADKSLTLHWDANYTLKQEQRQVWGEVLGTTASEQEAKSYEGREDRARPEDEVAPPPGSG